VTKSDSRLLILDDEISWLNRHEDFFRHQGFNCIRTMWSKDAIDIGGNWRSIQYAIIDQVLFAPGEPLDRSSLQDNQGISVIREISRCRRMSKFPTINFVMITNAFTEFKNVFEELEEELELEKPSIFAKDTIGEMQKCTYQRINYRFSSTKLLGDEFQEELPQPVFDVIVSTLAKEVEFSNNPQRSLNSLMRRAKLPDSWIRQMQGGWSGNMDEDCDLLVRWAINKGRLPDDSHLTALGSILRILNKNLGEPRRSRINSIIIDYNL
jgi:hypothetical protein